MQQHEEPEDDEEAQFREQLRLAMEASKAETEASQRQPKFRGGASNTTTSKSTARELEASEPSSSSGTPTAWLSERAQMERERLARLKRMRGESVDEGPSTRTSEGSDARSGASGGGEPPRKRQAPEMRRDSSANNTRASSSRAGGGNQGELFWDGEVRQTKNKHVDAGKNGEDGKPVFGLTSAIGNVRLFLYSLVVSRPADLPLLCLAGWIILRNQNSLSPSSPPMPTKSPGSIRSLTRPRPSCSSHSQTRARGAERLSRRYCLIGSR